MFHVFEKKKKIILTKAVFIWSKIQ